MSLKEQTKEIYQRYGLTDEEIKVYMVFLSYPQFTVSEVAGVLDKEEQLDEIQKLADKLEQQKLIKKIPGVVERYVPMEPYLEVFTKETTKFRENIEQTKFTHYKLSIVGISIRNGVWLLLEVLQLQLIVQKKFP